MSTRLFKNWWLLLLKAIFSLTIGLLIIIDPQSMAGTMSILIGILVGAGGVALIGGAYSHRVLNSEWTWWLIEGLIDITICLILLLKPVDSATFLCFTAGIWMIIMGFIHLATAINFQYYISGNKVFIFTSILLIGSGLFFLFRPEIGLRLLMTVVGAAIICYGLVQFYISFVLKNVSIEEIGEIEDLY